MTDDRRAHKRYAVRWRGRISLPSKEVHEIPIVDVSSGGVAIHFMHAITVGTNINIEFFVKYRGNMERIRAKTAVAFNTVLADNRGAKLGLQFTAVSKEALHVLNNVLHVMEDQGY